MTLRAGMEHVRVRVLHEDGSPYATVLDNNLKTCIVALPGKVTVASGSSHSH